jgi:hypothetical protein
MALLRRSPGLPPGDRFVDGRVPALLGTLVAIVGFVGFLVFPRAVQHTHAKRVALALEHDELTTLIRDERFEEAGRALAGYSDERRRTATSKRTRW